MAASVIRQYEERELFRGSQPGDSYGSAINRYYKILKEKTRDLEAPSGGFTWYGFNRMPEREHYYPLASETPTLPPVDAIHPVAPPV